MFFSPTTTQPKNRTEYTTEQTPQKYTLAKRLWGPMYSHLGVRLGIVGRLLYGWLYTDDPYFASVDKELRDKGL